MSRDSGTCLRIVCPSLAAHYSDNNDWLLWRTPRLLSLLAIADEPPAHLQPLVSSVSTTPSGPSLSLSLASLATGLSAHLPPLVVAVSTTPHQVPSLPPSPASPAPGRSALTQGPSSTRPSAQTEGTRRWHTPGLSRAHNSSEGTNLRKHTCMPPSCLPANASLSRP
jgi:hypothetical protein